MDGFVLPDSPEFDEWLGQAQRRFERAYLDVLRRLVTAKSKAGNDPAAIRYAQCFLAVDDLAEDIPRHLNEAEPVLHAALTQAQQLNDQWRQMQCLVYLHHPAPATRRCRRGVALPIATGATGQSLEIPFYQAALHANHAWLQHRNGRFHLARQEALTALALWKDYPYPFQWLAQWVVLAVALRQGALADAVRAARAMLDPKQQRLPDDVTGALEMAAQTTEHLPTGATKDRLLQAAELARGCGYL